MFSSNLNGKFNIVGDDNDRDENDHIHTLPIAGGKSLPLINGEKNDKFYFGALSDDGERLYYTTNKDSPNYLNIRRYDLASKRDELLLEGSETPTEIIAVRPGGTTFVYCEHVHYGLCEERRRAHLFDSESGSDPHSDGRPMRSYFMTNYDAEFSYVASFEVKRDKRYETVRTDDTVY